MSDLVTLAIKENRPLYAATAIDEDGTYQETIRFNTFMEAFQYAENAFSLGAQNVTFSIHSVDSLREEVAIQELLSPSWENNV